MNWRQLKIINSVGGFHRDTATTTVQDERRRRRRRQHQQTSSDESYWYVVCLSSSKILRTCILFISNRILLYSEYVFWCVRALILLNIFFFRFVFLLFSVFSIQHYFQWNFCKFWMKLNQNEQALVSSRSEYDIRTEYTYSNGYFFLYLEIEYTTRYGNISWFKAYVCEWMHHQQKHPANWKKRKKTIEIQTNNKNASGEQRKKNVIGNSHTLRESLFGLFDRNVSQVYCFAIRCLMAAFFSMFLSSVCVCVCLPLASEPSYITHCFDWITTGHRKQTNKKNNNKNAAHLKLYHFLCRLFRMTPSKQQTIQSRKCVVVGFFCFFFAFCHSLYRETDKSNVKQKIMKKNNRV